MKYKIFFALLFSISLVMGLDTRMIKKRRLRGRRLEEPSYIMNRCTHKYEFKDNAAKVSECKNSYGDSSACNNAQGCIWNGGPSLVKDGFKCSSA